MRKILMNAFQPATEVDDPERFSGRERQVRALADSFHADGSVPLIYGHRGLGKSSLALQLRRIGMGDVELLSHLRAEALVLNEGDRFITFYVTCTDSTKDFKDLLQLLINAAESIDYTQNGSDGARELVDRVSRRKLTLKFVEFESTKKYQVESARLQYQDYNLEEKLVQLCELLTATYGQPVLFIIDELDRMRSTKGLASFLKAVSSDRLKFMLVGIANNVAEMLGDHQSLERRLVPVQVPLMNSRELRNIVTQAERFLREEGLEYRFTDDAKNRLARVASGFPWFVHVLGQTSLISASDAGSSIIHDVDIARAVVEVVNNRFAQQFADMYQNAVRDSPAREATLRAFAKWTDPDIPTGEIYRVLRNYGIGNPSVYRGHLCQAQYGQLMFTPAFQKRGLVRFKNEMFKAYVRLRPSIYQNMTEDVDNAWKKTFGGE